MGLKLKINIINDASQSSNALIKGDIVGAGYTINRYAFLFNKFKESKQTVKMVYITNFSSGGDGIISKNTINSIEGLVGKKVGVPRFSEAQTLVYWLLERSSLTKDQINNVTSNLVLFDTPDDAAKAFFAGKIDTAATWQPYLSQAQETTGARVLFSTKSATNLILDGIIFKDSYIKANPDKVKKFIEGAIKANSLYEKEFKPIKETMPLFATETDENIKAMTGDATLADYSTNVSLMKDVALKVFEDMSNIWINIGEKADPKYSKEAFDTSILTSLDGTFTATKPIAPKFTEDDKKAAQAKDNNMALIKRTLTINFEANLAVIKEESYPALNEFVDIAKVLNGAIIQIEGNTSSDGDKELNLKLSLSRAKSVAQYLQSQGVDPMRFVIVGNGFDKPVADNNTEQGRQANRRTDIYFKTIE